MNNVQTRPGEQIDLKMKGPQAPGVPVTLGTRTYPFAILRPLLSSKPMRRPNRSRPLPDPPRP